MFEFSEAYLKPFSWAKRAYDYMLGQSMPSNISITESDLVAPSLPTVSNDPIHVRTDSEWNQVSRDQVSTIGALYKTADQAEEYFNSLYTLVSSRIADSEQRVQELDSNLRVLLSNYRDVASTAIHIKGGDLSSIETSEAYYRDFGPLAAISNEGIFRLKDTGAFSSLRSLGGFAGTVVIEQSLGQVVENGNLNAITDGTRNTFWAGTFYSPAPLKADQNDIPWLPDEYKHGYACMLTYYMDRPTLATEVFIDPVISEPMDLVSISWTPMTVTNTLINASFAAGSGWNLNGTAIYASGMGVGNTQAIATSAVSGWVSQVFALPGNYLASGSTGFVSTGQRAQFHYSMKGKGDLYAGMRIIWYDTNGKVIGHKLKEDYPAGFYVNYRMIDSIPNGATSGMIQFGIFSPATAPASAYFDNVALLLGERSFMCNEIIDRPKTISLPEIVRSGRISFVLAQRNPRREILSKEGASSTFTPINNSNLDQTLQKATANIAAKLQDRGPGTSIFAYRVGLKELDLRYREHIPRGSMVSLPLVSNKEIREIWVTAEVGQHYNDNTKFYIYPFADDPKQKAEITPYLIGDVANANSSTVAQGEVLRIYTFEEVASGWYNDIDRKYITAPRDIVHMFDGTDREGKIRLTQAPHLRRPAIKNVQDWLDVNSIWPTKFDPNLQTIYGLPDSLASLKNSIREGNLNVTVPLSGLVSKPGYIPIKVTVTTDKWIAHPDTYGRPDISRIRTITAEELTSTTVFEQTDEIRSSSISFEAWLNSTTVRVLIANIGGVAGQGLDGNLARQIDQFSNADRTLRSILDDITTLETSSKYLKQLQTIYDRLKSQGRIPIDSTSKSRITAAVQVDDVYSTRFKPLIKGPGGTFIKLYWYSASDERFQLIPQSQFEVINPTLGLIRILGLPPTALYNAVVADYHYINFSTTEDHFSSVASYLDPVSESTSGITSEFSLTSRPLPITRNMTDYIDGRIPTLRLPNFERLDKDYYPVIEYYVNSNGELIFSRDFFKYGDLPANIKVEWATLGITPRVAVEVTRSGSPAVTPTIHNVSMRIREGSVVPTREAL